MQGLRGPFFNDDDEKHSIMNRMTIAFFLIALLLSPVAKAQESETVHPKSGVGNSVEAISLSEAIARAIKVSPSLVAAKVDTELAEARLSEAKAGYVLPKATVRVVGGPVPDVPDGSGPTGGFPKVDTDLNEMGPFLNLKVEALQPLFTFGRLSGYHKAAKAGVEAQMAGQKAAEDEVILQVKKIYFALKLGYAMKAFLNELNDRAESAKKKLDELLAENHPDVTAIDTLRMQVFFAEIEKQVAQVDSGIRLGMEALGVLTGGLGAEPKTVVKKSVEFHDIDLKPVDFYLSVAAQNRPEIRQLNELVEARQNLLGAKKADFFPFLFLGGFYQYAIAPGREDVSNPFLNDDFNKSSGGAAIGFEQNLSFFTTHAKFRQARAEYQKALADRSRALMGIDLEIRRAYSETEAKRGAVKASRRSFKAGRSWVTASTLNFGVGLESAKDLLEAVLAYSKVKSEFFGTIHNYDMALANLSRVVGKELSNLDQ